MFRRSSPLEIEPVSPNKWEGKVFDLPHARRLTLSRIEFLDGWLPGFAKSQELKTALDAGCGTGNFSGYLASLGLLVTAFDGRLNHVEEARGRHPLVNFYTLDVEDLSLKNSERFDLVFAFGLLYHLENPFRAIRNLFEVTRKFLLIEGSCAPYRAPAALLLTEGSGEDQSLEGTAFYPSESCLVNMLYRAGFPQVYKFRRLPVHASFRRSLFVKRERTMLLAARIPVELALLSLAQEVRSPSNPWLTLLGHLRTFPGQCWRFLQKPWHEKADLLRYYLHR